MGHSSAPSKETGDTRRKISAFGKAAPSIGTFPPELFRKLAQHHGQLCDILGVFNIIDLF